MIHNPRIWLALHRHWFVIGVVLVFGLFVLPLLSAGSAHASTIHTPADGMRVERNKPVSLQERLAPCRDQRAGRGHGGRASRRTHTLDSRTRGRGLVTEGS
jgi:hypothetical protein